MAQKILAAVFAVVSLAGCDEAVVAKAKPAIPLQRQALVRPVVAPMTPTAPPVEDAGIEDTLALKHESPSVDHLARARTLKTQLDAKGALLEARRALFTNPQDEEALGEIAVLARKTKQLEVAAQAWGRLARIRSDDATPCVQQARMLYQAKDYPGAVMAGRDGIMRDTENAEAHHIVGLSQLAMGELPGAIASFERVVDIEPGHAWALNNLGFAYLRANENEKAVQVLSDASERLPLVAYVHNNLGVALERLGRQDEAKVAYQHAMDLSPKYVKARINAARVARASTEPAQPDETMSDVPVHPLPENTE